MTCRVQQPLAHAWVHADMQSMPFICSVLAAVLDATGQDAASVFFDFGRYLISYLMHHAGYQQVSNAVNCMAAHARHQHRAFRTASTRMHGSHFHPCAVHLHPAHADNPSSVRYVCGTGQVSGITGMHVCVMSGKQPMHHIAPGLTRQIHDPDCPAPHYTSNVNSGLL